MSARKVWMLFCWIFIYCLFFGRLTILIADSTVLFLYYGIEHISDEFEFKNGSNDPEDSHGTGENVKEIHTETNWEITFDKLDSTIAYRNYPMPKSQKIKITPAFTHGKATFKITKDLDRIAIQRVKLSSGKPIIVDVSQWAPEKELMLWLVVSDSENGQFIITPVEEPS